MNISVFQDTINDKDIYGFDNNPNPPIGKR